MRVGTDLVLIERFKDFAENTRKLGRILTASEIEYVATKRGKNPVNAKKNPPEVNTIAGLYASKEAVLKALGIGVNNGVGFKDVEILHDDYGAPYVVLYRNAKKWFENLKMKEIAINITHDGDFAHAICIIA